MSERFYDTKVIHQGEEITFDAVLLADHTSRLEISDSASDGGESNTDRVTVAPDELSLEIGVTDCNADENETRRAVNAYRRLKAVQKTMQPLSVETRFERYNNMLIESISTSDDVTTMNAWKATILFRELLPLKAAPASSGSGSSSDKNKTSKTNKGSTTSKSPDRSVLSQVTGRKVSATR